MKNDGHCRNGPSTGYQGAFGSSGAYRRWRAARRRGDRCGPAEHYLHHADDLGYADLGRTGSRNTKTPHIDSLAQNGLLLTQGYSNSSICSPTRTGLLSGCYQYRFPVGLEEPLGSWAPPGIGLPLERRTMPEVLRWRGYETALIGKWHLGSLPLQSPLAHGYDRFFGIEQGAADSFRAGQQ